jgi:hypothetical protein
LSPYHFQTFRPRRPRHDDGWTHATHCPWILGSSCCSGDPCQVLSSPGGLPRESSGSASWEFAFRGSSDVVHCRFGLSVRTWVTPHRSLPPCSYRFFFIEWVKDEVGLSPTCLRPSQAYRLGAGSGLSSADLFCFGLYYSRTRDLHNLEASYDRLFSLE